MIFKIPKYFAIAQNSLFLKLANFFLIIQRWAFLTFMHKSGLVPGSSILIPSIHNEVSEST